MGDGNFRWYVARSEEDETWPGPYANRDEAVLGGRKEYDGDQFIVAECDHSVVAPVFDESIIAETVIEIIGDNNEECWTEDFGPEDWWSADAIKALEATLNDAVTTWLKAHPAKTRALDSMRNIETITPNQGT